MKWKTKALIQNAIACLPPAISHAAYYWVQRNFGALRHPDPLPRLKAAVEIWKKIQSLGVDPANKVFLEIGTGRVPTIPIAYWLMGANKTVTIDVNPYLKEAILGEVIDHILKHKNKIDDLFFPRLDMDRWNALARLKKNGKATADEILELCRITYIAPGDGANTGLEDNSADFHTSHAVFEHIPPDELKKIIQEGNRVIRQEGLFVHRIDYSDHFAQSDNAIPAINFLQYDDSQWLRYAGNRYMYMNRLRHDDFLALFASMGHQILINEPDIDERSLRLIQSGTFPLSDQFKGKPETALAARRAWLVTRKET